jgi:hypothetical protein
MAIKFHPDKNKELSEEEATAKMAEINGAFEKLGGQPTDPPTTPRQPCAAGPSAHSC